MANRYSTVAAIDIGATKASVFVGDIGERGEVRILGFGVAPASGLTRGVIDNIQSARDAVAIAVEKAEQACGMRILSATVGISGTHLTSQNNRGIVAIPDRTHPISADDRARAIEAASQIAIPTNRQIVHVLPRGYWVEGSEPVSDPVGMYAARLDAETHIVTGAVSAIQNLTKCVEGAGVQVDDLVLNSIAAATSVLTPQERSQGVALVDIGGSTTSIAVFDEGAVAHTACLQMAGAQLTQDLSKVLRCPIESAEELKITHGRAYAEPELNNETVEIAAFGVNPRKVVSLAHVCAVLQARTEEILEIIGIELKRAGYLETLAAGIVLTGGASQLRGFAEVAEARLGLPARVGQPHGYSGLSDLIGTPAYATPIGLVEYALAGGAREGDYPPTPLARSAPRLDKAGGVGGGGVGGARPAGRFPLNSLRDALRRRILAPARIHRQGAYAGITTNSQESSRRFRRMSLDDFTRSQEPFTNGRNTIMSIRYDSELLPNIKVVGVGGGGCNAVNRMVRAKIPGVTFVACNTDAQALVSSEAGERIRIGEKLTKGLGVGGDAARGERAADESRDELYELLRGTEMVFVTAGMGGGTGTGAAPVVAEIAKDCGALTIGVVTRPFAWEGARRMRQAEEGLERLRDKVDTLIAIPNSRLMEICPANCTVEEAFETADDVLRQAIQSISNIISQNGSINLDFNDVRTTMSEAGPALLAVGSASGENRAVEAARAATSSPLLDQSIDGAHNVLFNITHSGSLQLRELDMAARVVAEVVDPSANIIFGTVVDPRAGDEVQMTVIATGFPPRAMMLDDPEEVRRITDYGLPGVSTAEDAELPAFLRRNIRSLNAIRAEREAAIARFAERR